MNKRESSNKTENNIMCNETTELYMVDKVIPQPPLSPPILIRRYATWDEESMRIEEERVKKVLATLKKNVKSSL